MGDSFLSCMHIWIEKSLNKLLFIILDLEIDEGGKVCLVPKELNHHKFVARLPGQREQELEHKYVSWHGFGTEPSRIPSTRQWEQEMVKWNQSKSNL